MRICKHCGHYVRKVQGQFWHRMEHSKYSGVQSGGVTFRKTCLNTVDLTKMCRCERPEPSTERAKP